MSAAAVRGSQHCRRPVGSLAHTPSSSHRADSPANSPRVYFGTLALLYPSALAHDHRVRNASSGRTHPAAMAVNYPTP